MHGRNYIHRGINPKHILVELDSNGEINEINVCGFRSSKSQNQSFMVSMICDDNLSRSYFDPTAIEEGYSEESDLWSVGLIIYFMSTGFHPTNNIQFLKTIRANGKINFPENINIDPYLLKFIEFCLKLRVRGSMFNKNLKIKMSKKGI